jgi:hypothetical protein
MGKHPYASAVADDLQGLVVEIDVDHLQVGDLGQSGARVDEDTKDRCVTAP